jgi:RHS repeat-associated protein
MRSILRGILQFAIGVGLYGNLSVGLASGVGSESAPLPEPRTHIAAGYGKLPLHFEANAGQFDEAVKFSARGRGYQLFLTGSETVLALRKPNADESAGVRMHFDGANKTPEVVGESPLPGKTHYYFGTDPTKWVTNVAQHARVRYRNVYPGIDLVYYGRDGQLEYDWIVAAGADPSRIVQVIEGADRLSIDVNGDLSIETQGGAIQQRKPIVYQEIDGERVSVEGGYVLHGRNKVAFQLGSFDSSQPLIIDPVLEYSTYLGGTKTDAAVAVAVSATGEAYVVGSTRSSDFPDVGGVGSPSPVDNDTPFITKLNAAGTAIVYTAFFGEGGRALTVALDAGGSAYVTGYATPFGFPASRRIGPTAVSSGLGAFVVKLAPDGASLTYSTMITSDVTTQPAGFTLDAAGSVYLTGFFLGTEFPTTPGAFKTQVTAANGVESSFLLKLTPDGQNLEYSTLFEDETRFGVAVDATGVYIAGTTRSQNLPLLNAFQAANRSRLSVTGFFAKFNPTASALIYSSYIGGTEADGFGALVIDGSGNVYLAGSTFSPDFPAINPLPGQVYAADLAETAIVVKLDPAGFPVFATPLGEISSGFALKIDHVGQIYIAGWTHRSRPFPETVFLASGGLERDVFVARILPDERVLLFSTVIGGEKDDIALGLDIDAAGSMYVVGTTLSTLFPLVAPIQTSRVTPFTFDAFVLKISDSQQPILLFSSPNPVTVGQPATFTALVTAAGATGTVTFLHDTVVLGVVPLGPDGRAKLTVSTLSIGSLSITATYSGDSTHAGAQTTILQVVAPLPQDTVTLLTTDVTTVATNQTLLLRVAVSGTSGSTPTGTMTFFDGANLVGSTKLIAGAIAFPVANLTPGLHSFTALYSGDLLNKSSTSAPVTVTVITPATATLIAPANNSVFDFPAVIMLNATVSAPAGSTVTQLNFLANGVPIASLSTPPYTFAWATAPPGVHLITAQAIDNFGQVGTSPPVRVQVRIAGVTYYHHDLQGNFIAATDNSAQVVHFETYLPYGGRLVNDFDSPVAQPNGNRLWFHGKAQDESTGLQYFGARYYDPVIGRFMGVDPATLEEDNLQSLNRYAYGNNNPYKFTDPDGHAGALLIPLLAVGYAAAGAVTSGGMNALVQYVSTGTVEWHGIGGVIDAAGDGAILGPLGGLAGLRAAAARTATPRSPAAKVGPGEKPLPDNYVVVRGGEKDIPAPGTPFSGAAGPTLQEAARGVPNNKVQPTTAGEIRKGGGAVEFKAEFNPKTGRTNDRHVNICLGEGQCSPFKPPQTNPVPKSERLY